MRACAGMKPEDDDRATEVSGKLIRVKELTDLDIADTKMDNTSVEHFENSTVPVKISGECSSLLREWTSDWYCYWDNSYGMPKNRENDFVFNPPLSERMDDIVFSTIADPFTSDPQCEVDPVVHNLLRFRKEVLGDDYSQCLFGSESDYPFLPILIELKEGEVELDARTVLRALGAHVELSSSVNCFEMEQLLRDLTDDDGADMTQLSGLYNCLLSLSTSSVESSAAPQVINSGVMKPLIFYCGSDLLNPIPLFIVSRLSPSLVGGFISAIIHT